MVFYNQRLTVHLSIVWFPHLRACLLPFLRRIRRHHSWPIVHVSHIHFSLVVFIDELLPRSRPLRYSVFARSSSLFNAIILWMLILVFAHPLHVVRVKGWLIVFYNLNFRRNNGASRFPQALVGIILGVFLFRFLSSHFHIDDVWIIFHEPGRKREILISESSVITWFGPFLYVNFGTCFCIYL